MQGRDPVAKNLFVRPLRNGELKMENEELAAPPDFRHSPFAVLHSGFRPANISGASASARCVPLGLTVVVRTG
jgi:hypothetical protein